MRCSGDAPLRRASAGGVDAGDVSVTGDRFDFGLPHGGHEILETLFGEFPCVMSFEGAPGIPVEDYGLLSDSL